jgi:hypothetical protein
VKVLCRSLGHKWLPLEPARYEQSKAMAFVGDNPVKQEVNVTWVYDEVCGRGCGAERGWPT